MSYQNNQLSEPLEIYVLTDNLGLFVSKVHLTKPDGITIYCGYQHDDAKFKIVRELDESKCCKRCLNAYKKYLESKKSHQSQTNLFKQN